MSREHTRRVVQGIGIPVAAAVFIAAMLWAMSRILLAVDPGIAPWVALGFAANILVASALAAVLRGRRAFVMMALIVILIAAGGIAGAVVGEYPVESHVAQGPAPHGEPTAPPPGEPTAPPTGPPPAACEPSGADLAIAAPPGAQTDGFDTECLAAPAEEPLTVELSNEDSTVHNWALFTDPSGSEQIGGGTVAEPIDGGASTTYEVDPLDPGEYFYRCDFHPTTMTGNLVVE
jgi:hypothetical protein